MKMYVAGTFKQSALGFPGGLKNVRLDTSTLDRRQGVVYGFDRKSKRYWLRQFLNYISLTVGGLG
jgi:hypothetical protein